MATRSDIRTRARIRADQDASTFPTDTQYNYLIDEAGKEVWYDLIKSGWPISFSTASATTTGSFLPLATSFSVTGSVAFIRGVYWYDGTTYYELRRMNEGDRSTLYSVQGQTPAVYDVRIDATSGIGIEVPGAGAGYTVKVEYVGEWPGFTGDSTVWPGPARSDELVVLKAAIKGCRKENNDQSAQFLAQEYEYLKECVQEMASWTNMRHAAMIRDVRGSLGPSRLPGDYNVYGPDY